MKNQARVYGLIIKGMRPERPTENTGSGLVMSDAMWELAQHCWKPYDTRPKMDTIIENLSSAREPIVH